MPELRVATARWVDRNLSASTRLAVGLLLAVEFHEAIAGEVVTSCNAGGLLLNPVRPTAVRFMPALNISDAEVDIAVDRFERALVDAVERVANAK